MAKTGTREWAEHSENLVKGCENGCRYCYARYNAVHRFKRMSEHEWCEPRLDSQKLAKYRSREYPHRDGRIMFPTAHDITPAFLDECVFLIRKMLDSGNELLITTKPNLECIARICSTFMDHRRQITFRFTIGSSDTAMLKAWEPGAPPPGERYFCLQLAYRLGYETSVSAEPFFDCGSVRDALNFVVWLEPYVTDSIWIGMMNQIDQRVRGVNIELVEALKRSQRDENIVEVYNELCDFVGRHTNAPIVRWKDSIKKVLNLPEEEGVG